jgi:hypothetical protein
MDDFKKYMQHHANEMEYDEPGEAVWKNIAAKTKKTKQVGKVQMLARFAAAACFIFIIGSVVFLINRNKKEVAVTRISEQVKTAENLTGPIEKKLSPQPGQQNSLAKQTFKKSSKTVSSADKGISITRQRPERAGRQQDISALQNIENSFTRLVSMQLNKVRSLPLYAEGPEYYSEFKKQFRQLEEDENKLKKHISKEGLINENLDNLINTYQQKLNLLKLLQNEINKTNSRYKQNNHTDSTSKINYINI